MFSRPSLFLSLGLAHFLCSSSGSFQSSLSSLVSHNPSENYICLPTRPTPWAEKNKVSMIDTLKVSSDFDPCPVICRKKSPDFSASLFQQFPLDSGLRETICDSKNGLVHHHFVLHGTQSGIELTLVFLSYYVSAGCLGRGADFVNRIH